MSNVPAVDGVEAAIEAALEWGEVGVQVAARLDGELIVDTWAGVADPETGREVDGDSLFCPFSVTKAITGTALHLQAERGLVDYEAPVVEYWPEYGANGKEKTTVKDMLGHRAGVPQMPQDVTPETMADWDWMVERIAAFEPIFEPGTTNSYHVLVWGWLIGELVRRTDPKGRSFHDFARQEVLEPLGMNDTYLGLPDSELDRWSPVLGEVGVPNPDPIHVRELAEPWAVLPDAPIHNLPAVIKGGGPGDGSITSARSMSRLFAMLAGGGELDGVRLLSEERVRSFLKPRPAGIDMTNDIEMSVGDYGYWLGGENPPGPPPVGTSTSVLCQPGAGGSYGWADLDTGLSATICHNRMQNQFKDVTEPFGAIGDAIRAEVDRRR
jgi:CubicO group peptidase (beta-lactamase class C family)